MLYGNENSLSGRSVAFITFVGSLLLVPNFCKFYFRYNQTYHIANLSTVSRDEIFFVMGSAFVQSVAAGF